MSDSEKVKYVLELDVPGLVKGEGVEIPGLGVFENGGSYDITEEEAERYRDMHSVVDYGFDDEGVQTESITRRGETLLQRSHSMNGITVSTAQGAQPDPEPEPDVEEDEEEDPNLFDEGGGQ